MVKPDSHLAQIFCQNKFNKFTRYGLSNNNWISQIMLKLDRFSCFQKSILSGTHLYIVLISQTDFHAPKKFGLSGTHLYYLTWSTCYYVRESHLLIYIIQNIKRSMWWQNTVWTKCCDHKMWLYYALVYLWGKLIVEGRSPHGIENNLKSTLIVYFCCTVPGVHIIWFS